MIVTVDHRTSMIVSAALRSKASAYKQGNFLPSIACAWICLLRCHKMQFDTEFMELVSVVGYLNNIYEYVTVLSMMQEDWDRKRSLATHGGLVQYIFQRIIELVGCVTGGSGRRCQTFITRDFPLQDVKHNCIEIRKSVKNLVRDREREQQGNHQSSLVSR